MTPEDKENRIYEHRKECIMYALNRNLEWAKRTNEIAVQVRKWSIAFCLIFFGFLVKDQQVEVKWFHFIIGVSGICFFMSLDILQHYYSEVISEHRFFLNKTMNALPMMNIEELLETTVLPYKSTVVWSRWKKIKVISAMFFHETVLYFYGGLFLLTIGLLLALSYFH